VEHLISQRQTALLVPYDARMVFSGDQVKALIFAESVEYFETVGSLIRTSWIIMIELFPADVKT
jgi:hypothetical protein